MTQLVERSRPITLVQHDGAIEAYCIKKIATLFYELDLLPPDMEIDPSKFL